MNSTAFKVPHQQPSKAITEFVRRCTDHTNSVTGRRPGGLDVVKIDGQWAQVHGSWREGPGVHCRVRYLATNSGALLKPETYRLKVVYDISVRHAMMGRLKFTSAELQNIWWGPEQERVPLLRLEVTVFGEFEQKAKEE